MTHATIRALFEMAQRLFLKEYKVMHGCLPEEGHQVKVTEATLMVAARMFHTSKWPGSAHGEKFIDDLIEEALAEKKTILDIEDKLIWLLLDRIEARFQSFGAAERAGLGDSGTMTAQGRARGRPCKNQRIRGKSI